MPMFRSGSNKSTLSVVERRVTKYQKFLNVSNVVLLITSTMLIFTAVILIKFYHVTKLDFWESLFGVVPPYIITLGIYTFVVSFFGFAISGYEKRRFLIVYAVLLGIAFLATLGSIFVSLELRSTIEQVKVTAANVNEDLNNYTTDPAIKSKWDELQTYFHCCGGNNFMTGYNDYRSTPLGMQFSVPDSCCHEPKEGCGQNIFKQNEEQIRNKIFVHGCLTVLQYPLEHDVVPMMVAYACIGVFLALVELITVVLSAAYIAQISRRERRNNRTNYQLTDRVGDAGRSLKSGGETDI